MKNEAVSPEKVFQIFAKDNKIPKCRILDAVRAAGVVVTDDFSKDLIEDIEFEEFSQLLLSDAQLTKKDLTEAFSFYDKGNTGYIDMVELERILRSQGFLDSEIETVFMHFQPTEDGRICYRLILEDNMNKI